jgi:hypothetical protein
MESNKIKKRKVERNCLLVVLVMAFSVSSFSCKKYLDVRKNSNQGTLETAADCQQILDNYRELNTNYPSDGESSADDYYLDSDGYNDPAMSQEDKNIYLWLPSAKRMTSGLQWAGPYKIVFYANLVLETLDKIKGTTDITTYNQLRGAALFYRSYAYWQVAQLYTKPYQTSTAGQDPGIPLRQTSDVNEISQRGNLSQTYNRITQDLIEALSLLPATSSVATRPNKAAAYAMLARVYLSMEDYPNALINANATLQLNNQLIDYNTLDPYSYTPFYPRFNKEDIFHTIIYSAPTLDPGFGYGNRAIIDPVLVNSYQSNDLRKPIFLKENMDAITGEPIGLFHFSGNYEPAYNAAYFNGLAVDEIYLIRAECYARAGNISGAMTDLNTLLRTRWKSNTYIDMTASSADEALTKILTERRKELLMRGLRWTDLRRLNKDSRFAKELTRTINGITYKLQQNDPRYTLLIPQEVIDNSGISQNQR